MTDDELLKGLRRMPDWGHWATTAAARIEQLQAESRCGECGGVLVLRCAECGTKHG